MKKLAEKESYCLTSEMLKEFSEINNLNPKLVKEVYYYYIDNLHKKINKDDTIFLKIINIGTFAYNLRKTRASVEYLKTLLAKEEREGLKLFFTKKIERFQTKVDAMTETIIKSSTAKQTYNKTNPNPKKILNR